MSSLCLGVGYRCKFVYCISNTVEKRLVHGEQSGHDKLSCVLSDKTEQDRIEFTVYSPHAYRSVNIIGVQRSFSGKKLEESSIHNRICSLQHLSKMIEGRSL